jgi:choline dehydrogenase-like flavoprotein
MSGRIIDGIEEHAAVDEIFDYVVVGSGAAGASAARVLSDVVDSLAIVEEGPAVRSSDFRDLQYPTFRRFYRGMGSVLARGRSYMPVLQGACLGGSTTVNSAIMWRMPDDVWATWRDDFGLASALPLDLLHQKWDLIDAELHVRPVPEPVWGRHNRIMDEAVRALGISGAPTRRGDRGCLGSGACLSGCRAEAKQSMLVSYLPYARERGAEVFASARVERVLMEGARAVGVSGQFRELNARRGPGVAFTLRARKAVLVAASAVQTPLLLQASGIRSAHLGRHFQAHPGTTVGAVFDDPVDLWVGATQGYDIEEHRLRHRFKLETIAIPVETAIARAEGVGADYLRAIEELRNTAVWGVQLRAWAEGRVRAGPFGSGPSLRYDLSAADMRNLRRALRVSAEAFVAAGAREVLLYAHGGPRRLAPDALSKVDQVSLDPADHQFILSHLFGTARMSHEPGAGVVDPQFRVHGCENLYVVDSSVFPTNLGVNPQQTIMGVAMLAADRVLEHTAGPA